jgi:hypothetical protein
MTKTIKLPVEFRLHDDGDLFAFFPTQRHGVDADTRVAYAPDEGHVPCHVDYAYSAALIDRPEVYKPLLDELKGMGYNLSVINPK